MAEDVRVEQVLLEWLGSLGPGEAALLGAIIGSLAAYGLREIEEVLRRRRELRGLLGFLNLETGLNEELINAYETNPLRLAGAPDTRRLSTKAWDAASIRLAQLLKDNELLEDLAEYYEEIRALGAYAHTPEHLITRVAKMKELDKWVPRVKELNERVRPQLKASLKPWYQS